MLNTFKYLFLAIARTKGLMVWALLFPLVLMTCFLFMFSGLDEEGQIEPIAVVVVDDAAYDRDSDFNTFIEELSKGNEDAVNENALFDVTFAQTIDNAKELLSTASDTSPDYMGIIAISDQGLPEVILSSRDADARAQMKEVYQSILLTAVDTYVSRHELVMDLMHSNPTALMSPAVLEALSNDEPTIEQITLTQNTPKESARYYFALLGFAAIMGGQVSLIAVLWLLPKTNALGARRTLGAVSRSRSLLGTLAACWCISFICLLIVFAYLRFIIGIDFAGRDLECLGALAAASIMATSLGASVAVLPKVNEGAKSGILTAIVCVASLFAGLYGQPTMRLADAVATTFPFAQWINPAAQVSQTMFSLMYYDSLVPYLTHVFALLAMALVLFACSAAALRRQRYASL